MPAAEPQAGISTADVLQLRPAARIQNLLLLGKRLAKRKTVLAGAIIVFFFFLTALFAPLLAPYHYRTTDMDNVLAPPGGKHLLGTDELGRDVLSRIIYGAQISLLAGVIAVGTGLLIGLVLGAVGGYLGGIVDYCIVGLIDVVWSFPVILLAITLVAILQPGFTSAMIALGLVTWPSYARVVRGQVLALKEREFVEAARALGCSHSRIIFKHILPNTLSPVIVMASLGFGNAIIVESTLSYLGLGAQPPKPSWGSMLSTARSFIYQAPWLTIIPGLAIILVVLGFNLFGDGLRDILDPRLRD